MDERKMPWSYLALFLSGAAVGAVAGVLLAPDSGPETRRRLKEWLREKRARAKIDAQALREALVAGRRAYRDKEREAAPTGV